MGKLRFRAIPGMFVSAGPSLPGRERRYIGHTFLGSDSDGKPRWEPNGETHEVDESNVRECNRLKRAARVDKSLIPDDQHTAAACGLTFAGAAPSAETKKRSSAPSGPQRAPMSTETSNG